MTSFSRANVSSPARAARLARPATAHVTTTNPIPRAPTPRPVLPLSSRPLVSAPVSVSVPVGTLADADTLAFHRLRTAVLQAGRAPWRTLRPLARRLFGADAFTRVHPGAPARLRLTRAHLAQLATTPQQTSAALRALRRDGKLAEVGGGLGPGFGPEAAARLYASLAQQALAPVENPLRLAPSLDDGARVARLAEHGGADRAVACPRGHGILARWATWVDVDDGGATVRVVSIHRPPPSDSALGAIFAKNLERLVDDARGAALVA